MGFGVALPGLRVSWVDLWEQAGFAERLRADDLAGLDAEIYEALKGTSDESARRAARQHSE